MKPLARKLRKYGDVEDVEQELRIEVWRAQQAYKPDGRASLRTYCWHYALNRVRRIANHHNRQKRSASLTSLDDTAVSDDHGFNRGSTFHELVPGYDPRASAGSSMDLHQLNATQLEAAKLLAAGLTFEEAGKRLGISKQAVYSRLTGAAARLRKGPKRTNSKREAAAKLFATHNNTQVAETIGVSRKTARLWRRDHDSRGIK